LKLPKKGRFRLTALHVSFVRQGVVSTSSHSLLDYGDFLSYWMHVPMPEKVSNGLLWFVMIGQRIAATMAQYLGLDP
jgi:hypothetical protein